MKNIIKILLIVTAFSACKKNEDDSTPVSENYSSMADFYNRNAVLTQTYTVNGVTGGSVTTPEGTKITIPANAFVNISNVPQTGTITIKFKDIYKKSNMLLSNMPTISTSMVPLVSSGEFYIKALNDNHQALNLAAGKNLEVALPFQDSALVDTAMQAFVAVRDTFGGWVWDQSFNNNVSYNASEYLFNLYQMGSPADSGIWCNSDNSSFFNSLPITSLTLHPTDDPAAFQTDVFLVFTDVNSMIHVYKDENDFPYNFSPIGFQCTLVAVGTKDGDLYSSFVPITISSNLTVNFTLTKTTTEEFKTHLATLN